MLLSARQFNKISFDINDHNHIFQYKTFKKSGKWGHDGCPFILEFPYYSVPDMIKYKLIDKYLEEFSFESRN